MAESSIRSAGVSASATHAIGPVSRIPPGCFLGIETSWRVGSVALAANGSVVARRFLPGPATHAEKLIPAVGEVLEEAEVSRKELAGVVIGAGPGSFTGVRIGVAAAKGLAVGLDIPLYPTSSLRAASFAVESVGPEAAWVPGLARELGQSPGLESAAGDGAALSGPLPGLAVTGDERQIRYVILDARGGRVYGACYDVGVAGSVQVIPPHGGTIVDLINRKPPRGAVFTGDGAAAHAKLVRAAGYTLLPAPAGVPLADAVLRCCKWKAVEPGAWEPRYVRSWKPG